MIEHRKCVLLIVISTARLPVSSRTCHRHRPDVAAPVLTLKSSCFTHAGDAHPRPRLLPPLQGLPACPRTMRVVSTPSRGAEPTFLGDGVQVDHENATYLPSEPISCGSPRIGIQ